MKCVRLTLKDKLGNSKIVRVKDGKAAQLVQSGQGKYCPKHVYKYREGR